MTCTDGTVKEYLVPLSFDWDGEALLMATPNEGEPDVLLEAGQIEPGEDDGDREGGSAQQMETR